MSRFKYGSAHTKVPTEGLFLNELIKLVYEKGLSQTIYAGFHILTFIVVFVLAAWYGKKLQIGIIKSILIVVVVYPLADFWKKVLFWIESGFKAFGGENNVRLFIWVPVIAFVFALLLKIDKKRMCDFLAPCMVITQGVGHWGCIFPGCCRGYESAFGIYNVVTESYLFPIQPIEALIAISITVYLLIRSKKRDYKPDGLQYPIMLMLFGSTRFICEFFRDNTKVLFGCSSLAFHALLAFIIGLVAYVLIKKRTTTTNH